MGQCNYLNDLGLLQRLVFMLVLLSWCFWFMCVCLYIPYILLYSPQEPGPPPDTRIRPAKDFYSGQVRYYGIAMMTRDSTIFLK